MALPSGPFAERIGFALCRVIVPLWVFTGATFKLVEKTPRLLPQSIWETGADLGVNLYWLLFVLVALEFFAVGVMLFLPRLARWMAVWMLGCFCLILLAELAAGRTKCGCLGAYSPSPWLMLAIDGTLLLGVVVFRPRRRDGGWWLRRELGLAAAWTLVGVVAAAGVILPENRATPATVSTDGARTAPSGGVTGPATGAAGAVRTAPARSLPGYYTLDADALEGQVFLETELAGFVEGWPAEVTEGLHHVVFFSRSCDHCRDLLEMHFMDPPPIPTTLVAIPEGKDGFNESTWIDMAYCAECVTQLELPVGVDWVITPPVIIAVEAGTVACAREADDSHAPECLLWR